MLMSEKRIRNVVKSALLNEGLGPAASFVGKLIKKRGLDVLPAGIKAIDTNKVSHEEFKNIIKPIADALGIKGIGKMVEVGKDWGPTIAIDCKTKNRLIDIIENRHKKNFILQKNFLKAGVYQYYEVSEKTGAKKINREVFAQGGSKTAVAYYFCDLINLISYVYAEQHFTKQDAAEMAAGGLAGLLSGGIGIMIGIADTALGAYAGPKIRKAMITGIIEYQHQTKVTAKVKKIIKNQKKIDDFNKTLSVDQQKKYRCYTHRKYINVIKKKKFKSDFKILERGVEIYFDQNKSTLTQESKDKIKIYAKAIQQYVFNHPDPNIVYRSVPVRIYGFASSEGEENYNEKLSEKRAMNVAEYFNKVHKSIPIDDVVGVGEISKNEKEKDRKVVITIKKLNFSKTS